MYMDPVFRETWAWFVIGMVIFLTRYAVRIRTVGFKGFQGDDYMTIGTVIMFTVDAATVTTVSQLGNNLDVTEANVNSLTSSQIAQWTLGSKLELTAWYSYSTLIWCMKFTMLFFYQRLTLGSLHAKIVRYLFWICGLAYLAVFLTISLGCYPIQMNWQVVPMPPLRCSFRKQNTIVVAVLNILTDAAVLGIPIPMLWRLKIPIRKKVVIALVLSSGLFVITAAIIRVVYSLDANPSASNVNRWGIRETIIGIVAINIPILRPLFTRAFWVWGAYDPQAPPSTNGSKPWRGRRLDDSNSNRSKDVELATTTIKGSSAARSESQEGLTWTKDNQVFVRTTYDIQTHDRDDLERQKNPDWNVVRVPR